MGLECTKIPAIRAAGSAGGGSGGTVGIDLAPSRFHFLIIGLNRASFKPVGPGAARLGIMSNSRAVLVHGSRPRARTPRGPGQGPARGTAWLPGDGRYPAGSRPRPARPAALTRLEPRRSARDRRVRLARADSSAPGSQPARYRTTGGSCSEPRSRAWVSSSSACWGLPCPICWRIKGAKTAVRSTWRKSLERPAEQFAGEPRGK